jgi:putative ABC transport system permease protein
MTIGDIFGFAWRSLRGYPLRTGLMLLAMAIGVASVVLLTALGEGARRYVSREFTSLGTHLLIVLPGRSETTGGPPPLLGETPRDLTLEDAMALMRSSAVRRVAPVMVGSAPVARGGLARETVILGSTAEMQAVRNLSMSQGRFLPEGDASRAEALCVLGHKLKTELFGNDSPLGQFVRIGDRRFRVIGVLARRGQSLGVDISDVAIIPVASAAALFNRVSLFRILVQARHRDAILRAKQAILDIIRERHDGEDDITVITQDAMLATFDRIFQTLTLAVGGIAAISLAVAGILIMNVMLIAVSQRTGEIGLLKALGAPGGQILRLFLSESAMLSLVGASLGLLVAGGGLLLADRLFPNFPLAAPLWAPLAAVGVALSAGLLFGVMPARRAARLDPVAALSRR